MSVGKQTAILVFVTLLAVSTVSADVVHLQVFAFQGWRRQHESLLGNCCQALDSSCTADSNSPVAAGEWPSRQFSTATFRMQVDLSLLSLEEPWTTDCKPAGVISVPPPPSASTLTISGLVTLGTVQLSRSGRQLRFNRILGNDQFIRLFSAECQTGGFILAREGSLERPGLWFVDAAFTADRPTHWASWRASMCRVGPQSEALVLRCPRGPPLSRSLR